MKKIIEIYEKNKKIDYLIIAIIGIIISIPLISLEVFFWTHDGFFFLIKLQGTAEAITSGQFPPLIGTDFCLGGRTCG